MGENMTVEISVDGDRVKADIGGNGPDLVAAAAQIINLFYIVFAKVGEASGAAFKLAMQELVSNDKSPVWNAKFYDEKEKTV